MTRLIVYQDEDKDMVMTHDELKAAVAAEEAETAAQTDENATDENESNESPQDSEDETKPEVVEDEEGETGEAAEPDTDKPEESETEDWMKGDDHTSQAEKKYTGGDIGKAKAKLKAKLADKDSELEKAKARIAELETAPATAQTSDLTRPKREDFFEKDDPDAAFDEAFEKYLVNKVTANQSAQNVTNEQERAKQVQAEKFSKGEDNHYERAAKLVKKSGINPETYQAADSRFRTMIENAAPGMGEGIVSAFLSKLGEGSEKVIYNLGINTEKEAKFNQLLQEDPTGFEAFGYLVELKTTLASPVKRTTNAPAPAPSTKGDATVNSSVKAFKKAYNASSDLQERLDIRYKAKKAGVSREDINNW